MRDSIPLFESRLKNPLIPANLLFERVRCSSPSIRSTTGDLSRSLVGVDGLAGDGGEEGTEEPENARCLGASGPLAMNNDELGGVDPIIIGSSADVKTLLFGSGILGGRPGAGGGGFVGGEVEVVDSISCSVSSNSGSS